MIEIEDQVANYELSQEMEKLGAPQDSTYSYFQYDKWNVSLRETKEIFSPNNEYGCNKDNLICSAPSDAELGEMLPTFYTSWRTAGTWACGDELAKHGGLAKHSGKGFIAKTEADARAKMWIYLKKDGVL